MFCLTHTRHCQRSPLVLRGTLLVSAVLSLFAMPVGLYALDGDPPAGKTPQANADAAREAEMQFPVTASALVKGKFNRSEGIAFNGEGDLFVTANAALWRIDTAGEATKLTDLYSNLGLAPIGKRDVLVADFGPTSAFDGSEYDDGIVWRVTPEGKKKIVARGIGDPNFILVLKDGTFLVSDDATNEIFKVEQDGTVNLFTTAVNHPNGLALSADETVLYIAQIFNSIRPITIDNRLWALQLEDGRPKGQPTVVAKTGERGANDGLARDVLDRIYIAANGEGKIYRFDPATNKLIVVAENMPHVASLAFGRGEFDHKTIYATSTRRGGGTIWMVPVGVEGAPLYR
ncbi:MAG: SMP-30/gluconolactonase/LRE family protein [Phycisphaerales bacterium]|nr:MAG: SMP-30/gluconolactonase/LRE family protein [Phycisphaerales bacterium]